MRTRELKSLNRAEWDRLSIILTDAFWRTPMFNKYLFQGRKMLASWFMKALLRYGLQAGRLFVAEDAPEGLVACALWSLPDSPEMNLKTYLKLGMWPWMLRIAVASPRAMARINELFRMLEAYAPAYPCATLEFLASAKKGAGAAVVRGSIPAFLPSPLYVESIVSQNDHAFYRQFGFEPFARRDYHGTDYAFMVAQPNPESGNHLK